MQQVFYMQNAVPTGQLNVKAKKDYINYQTYWQKINARW